MSNFGKIGWSANQTWCFFLPVICSSNQLIWLVPPVEKHHLQQRWPWHRCRCWPRSWIATTCWTIYFYCFLLFLIVFYCFYCFFMSNLDSIQLGDWLWIQIFLSTRGSIPKTERNTAWPSHSSRASGQQRGWPGSETPKVIESPALVPTWHEFF